MLMLGERVIVTFREQGTRDGDHVATLFGVMERGHDPVASLRESAHTLGSITPDPMPPGREAILFTLAGQDGSFCLRPDQFIHATWVETADPEFPSSPQRELVIRLGGVEVVETTEDS